MTIEQKIEGNQITFMLTGRLETVTSPELEKALAPVWEKGEQDIVLDFSGLLYLSSAGLRVLLQCEKKCTANKRTLTVINANASIREIFDITGFSDMLNIV